MAKVFSNTYIEPGAPTAINTGRQQVNGSLRSILTNFRSNAEPTFTNLTVAGETIGPQEGMLFADENRKALYIYDSVNTKRSYSNFTRNGIGYRLEESNISLAANAETYEIGELVSVVSENVQQFANSAVYLCISNNTTAGSMAGFLQLANANDMQLLWLTSNVGTFRYTAGGSPDPAEQNVLFTTNLFNIDEDITWTTNPPGVILTDVDDYNKILQVGDFDNASSEFVQVTANTTNHTDTITLYKISSGATSNTVAQVNLYKKNTSDSTPPDDPSGDLVYTFADNSISGTLDGWDTAMPSLVKGEYMWSISATADSPNSTAVIPSASFSVAVVVAIGGEDGFDAITARLTNPTFILPASSTGVVSSYTGSGTEIRLYEGETSIAYSNSGDPGTFVIDSTTVTPTGDIAVGTISDSGSYATVAQHASMDNSTDTVTITYNISGYRTDGTAFTASAIQVISKSKAGVDADPPDEPDSPLNTALLTLFQKNDIGDSAPTDPGGLTYTFSTQGFTTITNGWSKTAPSIGEGEQLWVIRAVASGTGSTDFISSGEWSPASVEGIGGESGVSVTVVTLFQKNSSSGTPPADPNGNVTYNFDTGAVSGSTNGWALSQPSLSNGEYIWAISASASAPAGVSTDIITTGEWSGASLVSRVPDDPDPPLNTAVLTLFQKTAVAASAPSDPATLTYTFATQTFTSSPTNGWSTTAPTIAEGEKLWVIRAVASSTSATDSIPSSEWSPASVEGIGGESGENGTTVALLNLFKKHTNGTTAPSDPSGTLTYTFSTGLISGSNNGWTLAQPSLVKGEYMWAISATASAPADQDTDTILTSEWSDASVVGYVALDGVNAILSNESHTIPCDKDGNPTSYTGSGTTLRVYEGTNLLTRVTGTASNGQFSVSLTNSNITGDSTPSGTTTTTYGVASNMTSDTASITFNISGKDSAGNSFTITKVQSFSKSKVGANGTDAKILTLSSTGQVFRFSPTGTQVPAGQTIVFIAEVQNTDSPTISWSSSPSVTLTGSGASRTLTWANFGSNDKVTVTASADSGAVSDSITVYKIQDGLGGLTAELSNDSHTIPVDAAGNNGNYTGSGTSIYVKAGAEDILYDGSGTLAGRFTTSASGSNITPGSPVDSGDYVTYTNASSMNSDTAWITYTITGKDLNGNSFSITKRQTFSKAYTGSTGDTGDRGPGRWNIDVDTVNYVSGTDGRLPLTTGDAQEAWDEAPGTRPDDPVANDQAWFYKGAESSPSSQSVWIYNGSSWVNQTEVIDGNLLVTGTITGDKLEVDTIQANKLILDGVTMSTSGDDLIIADYGVSDIVTNTGTTKNGSSTASYQTAATVNITIPTGLTGDILLLWSFAQSYPDGIGPEWGVRLKDGVSVLSGSDRTGMQAQADYPTGQFAISGVSAGTKTYNLEWWSDETPTENISAVGTLTAVGRWK